jgi:predicted DNA-binding transcriptional regulator AlpA
MTTARQPKYMSPSEVMAHFGISCPTLYRWISIGKLPSPVRFGRKTFFSADSIRKAESLMNQAAESKMLKHYSRA